jgi:hypothetical protein
MQYIWIIQKNSLHSIDVGFVKLFRFKSMIKIYPKIKKKNKITKIKPIKDIENH